MSHNATLRPPCLAPTKLAGPEEMAPALQRIDGILGSRCLQGWTRDVAHALSVALDPQRFADMQEAELQLAVDRVVERFRSETALQLWPIIRTKGLEKFGTSIIHQLQRAFSPQTLLRSREDTLKELISAQSTQDHTHYITDFERQPLTVHMAP